MVSMINRIMHNEEIIIKHVTDKRNVKKYLQSGKKLVLFHGNTVMLFKPNILGNMVEEQVVQFDDGVVSLPSDLENQDAFSNYMKKSMDTESTMDLIEFLIQSGGAELFLYSGIEDDVKEMLNNVYSVMQT